MSKKDYILIAKVFASKVTIEEGVKESGAGYLALRGLCWELARSLQNDNPRFDCDKFLIACGF